MNSRTMMSSIIDTIEIFSTMLELYHYLVYNLHSGFIHEIHFRADNVLRQAVHEQFLLS